MNNTINNKLNFSEPKIAGILNITTDSFYDGGKYISEKSILTRVENMLNEGADIIDIGAQSTRPNADFFDDKYELQKLIPIIKLIKKNFSDSILSVDTFWSKVAKESVFEGVEIINDISAGEIDSKMFKTVSELNKNLNIHYVLMHMKGTPKTMQNNTEYNNLIEDIHSFFKKKIKELNNLGIKNIWIDPGFGFSKTIEQNYQLFNNLDKLKDFKLPLFIGISRKGMIYKPLNIIAEDALIGTSALHLLLLQNKSANILRVHDVKEAKQIISLYKLLSSNK